VGKPIRNAFLAERALTIHQLDRLVDRLHGEAAAHRQQVQALPEATRAHRLCAVVEIPHRDEAEERARRNLHVAPCLVGP
jgi:hypothetical protein